MGSNSGIAPRPDALRLVSRAAALSLGVLPLELKNSTLTVAVASGTPPNVGDDIAFLTGCSVSLKEISQEDLKAAFIRFYGSTETELRASSAKPSNDLVSLNEERCAHSEPAETSAVSLANRIIGDAIRLHASDIHVEPYEKELRMFNVNYFFRSTTIIFTDRLPL